MPRAKRTTEERFWEKVEKTPDCWKWAACTSPAGYGQFFHEGKRVLAHRLGYEMEVGEIPPGMVIDHTCHEPACVRPDHLRLATQTQNMGYRKGASSRNKSSGVRNVHRTGNRWIVQIAHQNFGCYATIEEAEKVAIRERARLFDFPDFQAENRRRTA